MFLIVIPLVIETANESSASPTAMKKIEMRLTVLSLIRCLR